MEPESQEKKCDGGRTGPGLSILGGGAVLMDSPPQLLLLPMSFLLKSIDFKTTLCYTSFIVFCTYTSHIGFNSKINSLAYTCPYD